MYYSRKPRLADRQGLPLLEVPIAERLTAGTPVRIRVNSQVRYGVFIRYEWRKASAVGEYRRRLQAKGFKKMPKGVWVADGVLVSYNRRWHPGAKYWRGDRISLALRSCRRAFYGDLRQPGLLLRLHGELSCDVPSDGDRGFPVWRAIHDLVYLGIHEPLLLTLM
ncbi:hypothetical protein FPV67DRAFT_1454800 [Lyophyllum atratum]|nr:hypothetical protein FPV67DRAFT_1454800 [Lyophyllum atratum]